MAHLSAKQYDWRILLFRRTEKWPPTVYFRRIGPFCDFPVIEQIATTIDVSDIYPNGVGELFASLVNWI